MTKERGPLAVFERIRNAMPGGRGSAKEWLSCIWCFSLSASALVCLILWAGGLRLSGDYWILHWLSFTSFSPPINPFSKYATPPIFPHFTHNPSHITQT